MGDESWECVGGLISAVCREQESWTPESEHLSFEITDYCVNRKVRQWKAFFMDHFVLIPKARVGEECAQNSRPHRPLGT